jgi:hypothetical protein
MQQTCFHLKVKGSLASASHSTSQGDDQMLQPERSSKHSLPGEEEKRQQILGAQKQQMKKMPPLTKGKMINESGEYDKLQR